MTSPVALALLVSMLVSTAACRRAEWDCEKARAALGPGADVRFSAPPDVTPPERAAFVERFAGLQIAVPEDTYELFVTAPTARTFSATLRSPSYEVQAIRDPAQTPESDVFAIAGGAASAEGTAATQRLFGRPITQHELSILGFEHRRSDLTCDPAARDREQSFAVALALKSVSVQPKLEAVYRDRFGLGEITSVALEQDGRWKSETWVSMPDAHYFVVYRAASRAAVEALAGGTAIQRCPPGCSPRGPEWLQRLGEVSAKPIDPAAWGPLERALVAARASDKSIASIRKAAASLR